MKEMQKLKREIQIKKSTWQGSKNMKKYKKRNINKEIHLTGKKIWYWKEIQKEKYKEIHLTENLEYTRNSKREIQRERYEKRNPPDREE